MCICSVSAPPVLLCVYVVCLHHHTNIQYTKRERWEEFKGEVDLRTYILLKLIFLFHCVNLCLQSVSPFRTCVQVYLEIYFFLFFMLLSLISCFVIDFLSISKVIISYVIATDDRHPYGHVLYTKMLPTVE